MRKTALILTLAFLTACADDVGEGKTAATVVDVPTETAPAEKAPAAAGTAYKVDKAASKVGALGAKVTAQHPIDFKDFTGEVTVADGKATAINYTVQMATLESDNTDLTAHLLKPDFFDVANFPTSTFKSVSIEEKAGEKGETHSVSGDLTVRGTTKRVTFPATIKVEGDKATANAEFVINRQDFKIVYPGRPDNLIQDNVAMTISLVANKGV